MDAWKNVTSLAVRCCQRNLHHPASCQIIFTAHLVVPCEDTPAECSSASVSLANRPQSEVKSIFFLNEIMFCLTFQSRSLVSKWQTQRGQKGFISYQPNPQLNMIMMPQTELQGVGETWYGDIQETPSVCVFGEGAESLIFNKEERKKKGAWSLATINNASGERLCRPLPSFGDTNCTSSTETPGSLQLCSTAVWTLLLTKTQHKVSKAKLLIVGCVHQIVSMQQENWT